MSNDPHRTDKHQESTIPEQIIDNPSYAKWLLILYWIQWFAWAIRPWFFKDWLLENILPLLLVLILLTSFGSFRLSGLSYTFIFLSLCLHTIGAHYTYSLVPYDNWSKWIAGVGINDSLGLERNHYDRLVHFAFGLLLAYPVREVFLRIARVRGFWGYFLPINLTMSLSLIYEIIEWAAASFFGGDLGLAYLGTQGDPWDAQKDMTLASIGALIAMVVVALSESRANPNFWRELRRSLTVGNSKPD
jgi:putative membrane protein